MSYFTNLIFKHGIVAMFFIILIEYACFPISSEIVLPFSGAIASLQHINYFVILPVSVVAGLLGTTFCYIVGRIGGGALINKLVKKFPKAGNGLQSSQEKFIKYGGFAVCIGRLIPLCRTYIAFIAGAAKQNPVTFLICSFLGITVWNAILIGLGFMLHDKWRLVSTYYDRYKDVILPLIVLITLAMIARTRKKKNQNVIK
jgi:membrane protein DedA with SNARE-associated domain